MGHIVFLVEDLAVFLLFAATGQSRANQVPAIAAYLLSRRASGIKLLRFSPQKQIKPSAVALEVRRGLQFVLSVEMLNLSLNVIPSYPEYNIKKHKGEEV